MPAVSVIIPTYERADHLPRAIDSVLGQTFSDFEVIVVDDASTDGTPQIVRGYDDPRVRFIRFEDNRGANAARNAGIRASEGRYVSFLDSDDAFRPRNLAVTTDRLRRAPAGCAGVFTSFAHLENGTVVNASYAPEGAISYEALRENPIGGFSALMLRASVFETVGLLDEELVSHQDLDLFLRILRRYTLVGIGEVLLDYHIHGEKISSEPDRRLRGQEQFLEKHGDNLPLLLMGHIHYARALNHAHRNELWAARREFVRAIRVNPTRLRYYYHLGASLFGVRALEASIWVKKRANLLRGRITGQFP